VTSAFYRRNGVTGENRAESAFWLSPPTFLAAKKLAHLDGNPSPVLVACSGLLSHFISERNSENSEEDKMNKSGEQASGGDDDVLTGIARAVGSALGTVAGKVSKTPKAVRPKRSKSNSSAARRTKTAGKRKAVSKRRK
jgi:hypothetical protein